MSLRRDNFNLRESVANIVKRSMDKINLRKMEKELGRAISEDAELIHLEARKQLYEDLLNNPEVVNDKICDYCFNPVGSVRKYGHVIQFYVLEAAVAGIVGISGAVDEQKAQKEIRLANGKIKWRTYEIERNITS